MEADTSAHFLESGYRHLYELNFADARVDFLAYQKARPEDPLGKASEAASYLFEQFHQRGVLTSEFFVNDATFLGGVPGSAEQNHNAGFVTANEAARAQAKALLRSNPHDVHGLLALTIADGMESDRRWPFRPIEDHISAHTTSPFVRRTRAFAPNDSLNGNERKKVVPAPMGWGLGAERCSQYEVAELSRLPQSVLIVVRANPSNR